MVSADCAEKRQSFPLEILLQYIQAEGRHYRSCSDLPVRCQNPKRPVPNSCNHFLMRSPTLHSQLPMP
ncbi:hypothetical protein FJTKL_02532 [Diaporthe vaccinii]|uniref:Uncharacterized protein n=1 Tax=Diaporthe vaccinii TaxID=105482 RepID=A0ABR4DY41_9PEZI